MGDITDRTAELRATHPRHLVYDSHIRITSAQLVVLRRFLDDLSTLGDGLNFTVESCIDYDPAHDFSWDDSGSDHQDAALSRRIEQLCKDLCFTA